MAEEEVITAEIELCAIPVTATARVAKPRKHNEIADALVDLALDLLASGRVGGGSEESLHGLQHLVARTRPRTGVLGLVLLTTVEARVLSEPVVDETGDVLLDVLGGAFALQLDLAVDEGLDDQSVDLVLLGLRQLDLAADLANHGDHCGEDGFALVHHCVLLGS